MSIKKKTFELCKSVWASADRKSVQDLFNHSEQRAYWQQFSYFAKQVSRYDFQFYSYLYLDEQRGSFSKSHAIPILPAKDRSLLASAHRQLLKLNVMCLAPLVHVSAACTDVFSPYYKYAPMDINEGEEIEIFDKKIASELAAQFHDHPALKIVLMNSKNLPLLASHPRYRQEIQELIDSLIDSGARKLPADIEKILLSDNNHGNEEFFHYAAAVGVITSLTVINQLLFQAVLAEKLAKFDSDNCMSMHITFGRGISLVHQSQLLELVVEPNDIVLVENIWGDKGNYLCRIENTTMSPFPAEFGTTGRAEMRIIDDNLNPYNRLLPRVPSQKKET